jgi:hypothetical protein
VEVQSVYDDVVVKLREFRGAMSPTAAAEEPEAGDPVLEELRAIRRALEK